MGLSLDDKFKNFLDVLKECNNEILEMKDEDIETHIFENFDTGVISFMYKDLLNEFKDNGYINDTIYKKIYFTAQKNNVIAKNRFMEYRIFKKIRSGRK